MHDAASVAAVTRGEASAAPVPEVAAVIASWVPYSIRDTDAATQAAVMPVVREMVAAVGPKTPQAARRLLWALAPMAARLYRELGVFDAAALNHDNVEIWVSQMNADRRPGWRNGARAALKRVGFAVNPLGWPRPQEPVARQPAVAAYTPQQQAGYIDAAALAGFENPEGRRWVVGGSIGAGMNGPELAAAEIGDLRELGGGRLAVQVRGRNPRLVPIRGCCTNIVREAVSLVQKRPPGASRRFVLSTERNAGAHLANKVTLGRGRGLSLPRARNTWLTAHLQAETPLLALCEIARPLSAATLNDLLAAAASSISAEQATAKGMRA